MGALAFSHCAFFRRAEQILSMALPARCAKIQSVRAGAQENPRHVPASARKTDLRYLSARYSPSALRSPRSPPVGPTKFFRLAHELWSSGPGSARRRDPLVPLRIHRTTGDGFCAQLSRQSGVAKGISARAHAARLEGVLPIDRRAISKILSPEIIRPNAATRSKAGTDFSRTLRRAAREIPRHHRRQYSQPLLLSLGDSTGGSFCEGGART